MSFWMPLVSLGSFPGAAFVASAQRLGWTVTNATAVIDDRGNPILFERDSPAMVRSLVEKSVRRWRWRRVESKCPSLHQGAGGFGVHVAPLFKLMRTKSNNIGANTEKPVLGAKLDPNWTCLGTQVHS